MADLIKKEGFNFTFNPKACESCQGNCCIGESGYIWVSPQNIKEISQYLNISQSEFITKYLSKIGYRYTIKEQKYQNGYRCVFFNTEKRGCEIYPYRPLQCRTFPFWEHFKNRIEEVKKECPGISIL
jgi:uncharacterized protein